MGCTRVGVFFVLTSCIALFASSQAFADEAAPPANPSGQDDNAEEQRALPCKVGVYQNRRTRGPLTDHRGFFNLSPQLGVPAVNGDLNYGDQSASLDASSENSLRNIDLSTGLGAEAGYCRTSVAADLQYLDLATDQVATNDADGDFGLEKYIAHVTVNHRYDLMDILSLGPLAGFRYVSVNTTLDAVDNAEFAAAGSDDWLDPILGVRGRVEPLEWLYVPFYADVGGIGFGSEISWQLYAGAGVSANGVDFELGYRHLYIDFESDNFDYDVHLGTPTLTTTFRF